MGLIDISKKENVPREAVAEGKIVLAQQTLKEVKARRIKKGDVFECARAAGLLALKRTPELLPHCHPINITSADIEFKMLKDGIKVTCVGKADYKTGVEMDVLTGCSVALLTIWDMVKYLEKDKDGQYPNTRIENIRVVKKRKG